MRIIYLACALIAGASIATLGASADEDTTSDEIAAYQSAAFAMLHLQIPDRVKTMSLRQSAAEKPNFFCGQCTQDEDCGVGHKCCGPSDCLECFQVATCPD